MRMRWLTDNYLPVRGGSLVFYHNICARMGGDDLRVITRRMEGGHDFDASLPYRVLRVRTPLSGVFFALRGDECALVLPLP